MKKLLQLLESGSASVFCLLFAIANRIIFTCLYSTIGRDTKVQLTYSENLLTGKGMGVVKYFTTDLTTPVFDTYWFFPPGFSFAIIPFLKIFGDDEYRAVLAFDIFAAALFIIAVRMVGKKTGLPDSLNNIVTIIAGCSQYPFFMSSSSTDVISLTFALFALAGMLGVITKNQKPGLLSIVGYSFLFFLPSFFRYMYLPVTIFLPLLILLCGFLMKNKDLKISGFKLLLGTTVLIVLMLSITSSYSGSAVHIYDTGRGIFFDQLVRWYPFLPASIINLDFAAQVAEKITGIEYSRVIFLLEILNALIFFFLCFLLIRFLFSHKKKLITSQSLFVVSGSLISLLIVAMLAYLSLTYKAQDWGEYKWTYSYDIRYFAFIYVFIPLLLAASIHFYPQSFKNTVSWILLSIIALGFTIEIAHGIYYNSKILMKHESLNLIRDRDKDYRSFGAIIRDLKDKNPGKEIWVCAPDQFYLHTASKMGYKAIFDYVNLNKAELKPVSKTVLLVPVHKQDAWIMKEYVEKRHPEIIAVIAGTSFYKQELEPQ